MGRTPTAKVLFVAAGMVVLLLGLFFAVRAISQSTFAALEQRQAEADVERLAAGLTAQQRTLASVASDWATWDEAYDLLVGRNTQFRDKNLEPIVLANLHLDVIAFVTKDGRVLASRRIDPDAVKQMPFPEGLRSALASRPDYLLLERPGKTTSGVLALPDGALVFAAAAVTDSRGIRTPPGYCLVGRFLGSKEIEDLSRQTGLEFSVYPPSRFGQLPRRVIDVLDSGALSAPVVAVVNDSTARGYTSVADPTGKPAVVFAVNVPRTIFQAGQRTMVYFGAVLILYGAFALLLTMSFMWRQLREIRVRRRAEELTRSLIANMPDAVFGLAPDGRIEFANPQASELTGFTNGELLTMSYVEIVSPGMRERVREHLGGAGGWDGAETLDIVDAAGRVVPVEVTVSRMMLGEGEPRIQWIARDITERRRYETELVHLACHDYLTGLVNRRRFEEELALALPRARRTGKSGALLWLDVDGFKEVNDTFGHKAGDQILIGLASVLQENLRGDSVLGRLGGDEFGILLPETTLTEATAAAQRLLKEISAADFLFGDRRVRVTASIGLVIYPDQGTAAEELLARADIAMYNAKQEDRNSYSVYRLDESWPKEFVSRFEWAGAIERALAEDRFLVYAQPIVRVEDGGVDRYELLIRLLDDEGQIVAADTFIRVAERVGLIHDIDRWMVRQAVALIARQRASAPRLDVNVSGKAVSDSGLLTLIETELRRAKVEPSSLGIEITETAAIGDMAKARAFIDRLKDIGCRVTLDDFGSGFSSFYYLNSLPVDGLKIDGGFVRNMTASRRDQHVVRAIVELCRGFAIESTAEWVEDEATFEFLKEFGVTHAQGWALGRPVPVEEALGLSAEVSDSA